MADNQEHPGESNWKAQAYMLLFWAIVLVMLSFFALDFFPFSLPIWGEWRFFIGK